jgi:hypothetical protein
MFETSPLIRASLSKIGSINEAPKIMSAMQVTDDWIIQRFLRLARQGEDEDLYEPWPGYTHGMTKDQALKALEECETPWPDHEFRAHRVRVH